MGQTHRDSSAAAVGGAHLSRILRFNLPLRPVSAMKKYSSTCIFLLHASADSVFFKMCSALRAGKRERHFRRTREKN
jgi:hypothetical protein